MHITDQVLWQFLFKNDILFTCTQLVSCWFTSHCGEVTSSVEMHLIIGCCHCGEVPIVENLKEEWKNSVQAVSKKWLLKRGVTVNVFCFNLATTRHMLPVFGKIWIIISPFLRCLWALGLFWAPAPLSLLELSAVAFTVSLFFCSKFSGTEPLRLVITIYCEIFNINL